MARVLVATPEPIGERLAGPAIRAAHIARVLGASHDVTLVSLDGESTSPIDGTTVHGPSAINSAVFDAAIVQGKVLVDHPELAESDTPLAVDWFDPFHLEALHRGGNDNILRIDLIEGARQTLLTQARRGDFFVCSNQTQRDHWLGWLSAAGRVNHHNHDADPTMAHLIDVAPFGLDLILESPSSEGEEMSPMRSMFGQIGPDDPILVWAGGLHDWLDPVTVVRAMPTVLDENPDARLVFLAGPHPNTSIETMGTRGRAIAAAKELRLFGTQVLFVNQWVPYEERLDWIADGSIGVVAHHDHLETRNSHRTRLLDHLAAGLPTVSSAGDPASELLQVGGAALLVPPGDPETMGETLAGLVRDADRREVMGRAARTMAGAMHWEQTLGPLVTWMENPTQAPDRLAGAVPEQEVKNSTGSNLDRVIRRTRLHWDDGGALQVVDRTIQAGRRRLGR